MNKSSFEKQLVEHGRLVYTCKGTSMMPLLREKKDLLVIEKKPAGRCKKYDAVLYKRDDGSYVLHRILKVQDSDYVMCGDNCYLKEYGITDCHIIGVLAGFMRNARMYTVNSRRYKLYVRLWCDLFPIRAGLLRIRDNAGKLWNGRIKRQ